MGKANFTQKSKFCLTGQVVRFLPQGKKKPKTLLLATADGLHRIKLANPLRKDAKTILQIGSWLEISGKRKVDAKKGRTKLKATHLKTVNRTKESVPLPFPGKCSLPPLPVPQSEPIGDDNPLQIAHHAMPGAEGGSTSLPKCPQATVLICGKSSCKKRGGKAVCQALERHVRDRGLQDCVKIKSTGCLKRCKAGPNLVVMPDKTRYSRIEPAEIPHLVAQHLEVS